MPKKVDKEFLLSMNFSELENACEEKMREEGEKTEEVAEMIEEARYISERTRRSYGG